MTGENFGTADSISVVDGCINILVCGSISMSHGLAEQTEW